MRLIQALSISAAVLVMALPVSAAENPWFGTWKLNPAKSMLTGSTETVTKIPNGYHFDLGAVKYDVFDDGQDHPAVGNRTTNLKSVGRNEWLLVTKVDGKETSHATMRLSSDGKELTEDLTGTHADGSVYTEHIVDVRVGSGEALAGTWKEARADVPNKVMVYSGAENGRWKMETPATQQIIVAPLDGTPVPAGGPRVMTGETFSFARVSDKQIKYTVFESGTPYIEGTETITPDGKVMKDVSWLVIKPSEKTTEIWEKQ